MAVISEDCIETAKTALSHFTEEELRNFVTRVFHKAQEYDDASGMEAIQLAMEEVDQEMIKTLFEDANIAAMDSSIFNKNAGKITNNEANLREMIVRRNRNLGDNIESAQEAAKQLLDKGMFNEMSQEDVHYLENPENDISIADAFDGRQVDSPIAQKIAGIIKKYIDFRNSKMVMSNALSILRLHSDRSFRGLHDPEAMMRGGRDTLKEAWDKRKVDRSSSKYLWRDTIKKYINLEDTFRYSDAMDLEGKLDMSKVDSILENIYDDITTDKYNELQRKESKSHRFFQWKDMRSQLEYNKIYGRGNLFSSIMSDIRASGNMIGSAEIFGSKPTEMYTDLLEAQQLHDPKSRQWQRNTELGFRYVMGMDKTAVNPKLATFFANMRSITSMARLPMLTFQALPDVAFNAAFAKRWGFDYFSSLGNNITHMFNLVSNEEREHIASLMKLNVDSHMGYMGRFIEAENSSEMMSKISLFYYKKIGIDAYDKGNRISTMHVMAKGIAEASDKKFHELSEDTRNQLLKYGFDENMWDGLRRKNEKGLFTTDNVMNLTDDELKDMWNGSDKNVPLYQYRNDLYRKVHSMFAVGCENAVLTPGAFMRAMMYRGTKPGEWGGELLRSFMQFKGFVLSYMDRVLYHGWKDMSGPSAKLIWATQMFAATLPLSYLSSLMTHAMQGQSMPDPTQMNPAQFAQFAAEMIQPNVWMLMGIADPHNQNPNLISSLFFNSPILKMASNAAGVPLALMEMNPEKAKKALFHTASGIAPLNTTPFVSPYIRQILGEKPHLEPGQQQYFGQ